MFKVLLGLFTKYGLKKGSKIAKSLGFKGKDVNKASKEYVRIYRKEDKYYPPIKVEGLKGKRYTGGGGWSGKSPDHTWFSSHANRKYTFDWAGGKNPRVMQFKVPKSYIDKARTRDIALTYKGKKLRYKKDYMGDDPRFTPFKSNTVPQLAAYGKRGGVMQGGIPERFLEKVYYGNKAQWKYHDDSMLGRLLRMLFNKKEPHGPGY